MGYSCTKKAAKTLEQITAYFRHDGSGNMLKLSNGAVGFWEIGRENDNGAITGSFHYLSAAGNIQKTVSFRIDPDGTIARFPGLGAKDKRAINSY